MQTGPTITTPSAMHPLHPKPLHRTAIHAYLPHTNPPNPHTHFHHSLSSPSNPDHLRHPNVPTHSITMQNDTPNLSKPPTCHSIPITPISPQPGPPPPIAPSSALLTAPIAFHNIIYKPTHPNFKSLTLTIANPTSQPASPLHKHVHTNITTPNYITETAAPPPMLIIVSTFTWLKDPRPQECLQYVHSYLYQDYSCVLIHPALSSPISQLLAPKPGRTSRFYSASTTILLHTRTCIRNPSPCANFHKLLCIVIFTWV
jgi:hypothetical protein